MVFEWFAFNNPPSLEIGPLVGSYLTALLYALLLALALYRTFADFVSLTAWRWVAFIGLLIATPALAQVLVLRPAPQSYIWSEQPLVLAGFVPILAAALWLGRAPAALVGLLTGATWSLFETGRVTQAFELALYGIVVAAMINQRYQGRLGAWARQPVVAASLATLIVAWPLALISTFATGAGPALVNLERIITAALPILAALMGAAVIAGGLAQAILTRRPDWHPVSQDNLQIPPWQARLARRMLYTAIPAMALATLLLVGVVAATSYQVATRLVINQMARSAANASSSIPFFVQVGRSLIRNLAQDDRLISGDEEALQLYLATGLRSIPYFQQLAYFDSGQKLRGIYPEVGGDPPELTSEELSRVLFALEAGAPGEVTIHLNGDKQAATMSFIAPITDPQSGKPIGALVGRTSLDTNPTLTPVIEMLQGSFAGSGEGFLVDAQNRILLYPDRPERQQEYFILENASELGSSPEGGRAFRQREADGTRQLVYILPVTGHSDWSVVATVPNEAALGLAIQIAANTLALLLVMAAVILPLAVAITRQITIPVEQLLQAADQIAEGQLDRPVHVTGEDEIGRLGRAFEQMRLRLKRRLSEQERLLNVSRSVSSSLELFRALPPILSSILDSTDAIGVRIALRHEGSSSLQTYAAGEAAAAMGVLDTQLINLVEQQGTVVISQLWRASGSLDVARLLPRIRALVAFPLRSERLFLGILWVGYGDEHSFEQAEMTFLSTLAGQAAIAVANARLFNEAQERRRELEAVVASTTDAMIVTDTQGRVILMNPAAEAHFNVRREAAQGKAAHEVIKVPELSALLSSPREPVSVLELPGDHGKTLLANTSTIVSQDGTIIGRVAVLRDITTLKKLDSLKTLFLRMVSHDLRTPLTYMQGYLTMLPLHGNLNDHQQGDLSKIATGIENLANLSQRVYDLSRLQLGEEAELDLVLADVAELIQEVCEQYERDIQKREIELAIEVQDKLPLLVVDAILFRQAIANLLGNALKYTPAQGHITIRAYNQSNQVTVAVQDNGIGIREEDQERLFEAGYRVAQREGDPPRPYGTGLGLALVKAIAEAHGGTVGFQSTFGVGSTFYITVPVRHPNDIL